MPPATNLGRYRQLAPRAAIHVSPLAFGTLTLGDGDKKVPADVGKESAFKLLDTFFDAGGNHIDTASAYQDGRSEQLIGEWHEARGNRDQLVIATKYTFPWRRGDESFDRHELYLGNNVKSMKLSVEASLKKLRTTYIDIFYLHFWDLHPLHILVITGKRVSGSPAWFVVKANDYAKANGKTPFVVFQVAYWVLERDIEREILPMCRHEGIALTVFRVLGGGRIRSDAEEERRRVTGKKRRMMPSASWERSEDDKKMCAALEVVAAQVGAKNITAVAIAYTMHKAPFVHPIIGGRNPEQLLANIEALDITLTDAQLAYIDGILPLEKGYPNNFIGEYGGYPAVLAHYSTFDRQPLLRPIAIASK
ncbi:aryl-alcohol dehydrogenase [Mycena polygramma]|nr:aryl-alcohol dehydrogenase [Mycena polygramma]